MVVSTIYVIDAIVLGKTIIDKEEIEETES